ncbi:penicillin-binding protein 2 [Clostridium fermenticellae]|uniref:Penicillin-binding protein 2 n=1 Tax=Clostridium fermenticellae TaxID=2068654 RepID=A0A386H399_9CLOT|nr:penicillin-binding transpeptidase domain-containing protein [Clostridium fermenticellae]AYD40134.1 penicillin-binding protein 2 [Clostridium fermenticellae]
MIIKLSKITIKKRTLFIFVVLILIIIALYINIVRLQCFNSNRLSVMAESQYSYKEDLTDTNFLLFDCNGKQLINYNKKYYAVISPDIFGKDNIDTKQNEILTLMYILRNYNSKYDLSKEEILNSSQKIYYPIDENTYNKLKNIKDIKGFYTYIYSESEKGDTWKLENLLMNNKKPDGSTMKSPKSLEGQIFKKTQNNKKPQLVINRDVNGKIISQKTELPENNTNVRLTVDKEMEDKIKDILNNDNNKKYSQIGVVLMEADTGKIKAMVQKDDSKPNINLGASTNHGFFPGSIFKVIVEEAGLDRKSIQADEKFSCRGFYEMEDDKMHGSLTPKEALAVSCNDVFAQIGAKVGFNNFYDNATSQGLFQKILGLDCEEAGNCEVKDPKVSDGTLGLMSIGQNIRITPVEAISIANTVANNGVYVKPTIVDSYVNDDNEKIQGIDINERQVIDRSTAQIMKDQMLNVVKNGTAKQAYMPECVIGGKTGSTQRMETVKNSNVVKEHSDGWFVGFFNIKGKVYSMVVFVKDIDKDNDSGGTTAVPIFKSIVQKLNNN